MNIPAAQAVDDAVRQYEFEQLAARVAALEKRGNIAPVGQYVYAYGLGGPYVTNTLTLPTQPFFVRFRADQAFDALAIDVVTAVASSTFVAGIYATDANGFPTTLLQQATLSGATIAPKTVSFTALPAGLYWYAVNAVVGAPILRGTSGANPLYINIYGGALNQYAMTSHACWSGTGITGLPDPFPANKAGIDGAPGSAPVAMIRVAGAATRPHPNRHRRK